MTRHQQSYRAIAVAALLSLSVSTVEAQGVPAAPHGPISLRQLLAENKLRVVNRAAIALPDTSRDGIRLDERANDGVAWITGLTLGEGTIDVDIRGKDVLQRSFVGVAFHGSPDGSFDAIYLRPFNFRATDTTRHKHAIQYVAMPTYDFARLRAERPDQFENPVLPEPEPSAWVHLRVVVRADSVRAYVNGGSTPTLAVPRLRDAKSGEVGVWVGNNSDGEFANLKVTAARSSAGTPSK